MPEGDSLHRVARWLGPALEGKVLRAFALPRLAHDTSRLVGARIERVEARGKHLLVSLEGGRVLHVHLGMHGAWHLYAVGEPWRWSRGAAVVVLRTDAHEAVCFRAPTVRLLDARAAAADPRLRALGPDVLAEGFDPHEGARRLRAQAGTPLGVALLDQRVLAGLGNVWKSELCFLERLDPFSDVARFDEASLTRLLARGVTLLRHNVEAARTGPRTPFDAHAGTRTTRLRRPPGASPLAVYGRAGAPCIACGEPIVMRKQGEALRSTYACPRCQPAPAGGGGRATDAGTDPAPDGGGGAPPG